MEQPQSSFAQKITPANELVPLNKQVAVGRCNNNTTLQNIPCLKNVGLTVKQVPNANESIRFMVDKKDIIYTVDMFRATLKLPVETLEQPFIPPDDTPLVNMYTTGEVTVQGMKISDDLLTDEIKYTHAYKDYVNANEVVEVPIIRPEPVECT
ncbi:hypothetical protein Tco_1187379 [Tanacetum coccineum]